MVVVGGGAVAERKIAALLKAGAKVTVISPSLTRRLSAWSAARRIREIRRPYRRGDLGRAVLAFTATDRSEVNRAVAREADQKRIFINIADQSISGGFLLPALFKKRNLTIAVSTGGKSPAMAKKIRDDLKTFFSSSGQPLLIDKTAKIRSALIEKKVAPELRRKLLKRLAQSDLEDMNSTPDSK